MNRSNDPSRRSILRASARQRRLLLLALARKCAGPGTVTMQRSACYAPPNGSLTSNAGCTDQRLEPALCALLLFGGDRV